MTLGGAKWLLPLQLLIAGNLAAQSTAIDRCGLRIPSTERSGYVGLPSGDVFCPLLADPKGLHSFLSYQRTIGENDSLSTIGSVGIADQFGIARWNGATPGNGVQLSLAGGVFAQFDLGAPSFDLLNADYVVGVPLTIRRNAFSTRLRVYHQSSHLGDEFLLRAADSGRVNLSFEAAEAILSIEGPLLRLYGGGEWLFNRSPDDLEPVVAHGGAELRTTRSLISLGTAGGLRPVAAIDLKASQEQDWKPSISIRAGIEFERTRGADPPSRRWSLLFESYTGPSPYGQFFREKIQYMGLGAHFQL
ncbi:MAG: DUF1207 domain-containing protein [Gemmatimonadaceae bacterium]|nr:DUF1207 domain-containing protein [Gemmatimonadaceae bacterium]